MSLAALPRLAAGLLAALALAGTVAAQTLAGAPLPVPGLTPGDELGSALAIGGDVLAVGAYLSDLGGTDSGAVYLFRRTNGGAWELAEPPLRGAGAGDHFGFDVALTADGGELLVGAPRARNGSGVRSGAVYHYRLRPFSGWPRLELGGREGDEIGSAVAIDGDTLAVGARRDDGAGRDAGRVYVLRGGTVRELTAESPAQGDEFGTAVSLDGDHLVAGAPFADIGGPSSGAAWLFELRDGDWQRTPLQAAQREGDAFGYAVAVRADTVAVGAPLADSGARDAGAVYLFRPGRGGSAPEPVPATPAAGDQFGVSVSLDTDGSRLVAGARRDDRQGRDAGAAFVFSGAGELRAVLTAAAPQAGAELGFAAAIQEGTMVVGAFRRDNGRGAAYVFESPEQVPEPTPLPLAVEVCALPDATVLITLILQNPDALALPDLPGDEVQIALPPDLLVLVVGKADRGLATVDLAQNQVTWSGPLGSGETVVFTLLATLQPGLSPGTPVTAQALLQFDRDGDGTPDAEAHTETLFVAGSFPCAQGPPGF